MKVPSERLFRVLDSYGSMAWFACPLQEALQHEALHMFVPEGNAVGRDDGRRKHTDKPAISTSFNLLTHKESVHCIRELLAFASIGKSNKTRNEGK
ncbi:hypothetical protein CC2G_013515 [Coprinopsis cinerea AmutBmut pab1-1]|nr:hypothetical protein CC2G_013515 [Coprinopsis cinerea AmutBmut pab1-1]